MVADVGTENGCRLISIFIKVFWLCLESFWIFVFDTATEIFHINFPKLSCQTVRCSHVPAWRYIAVGQFGKSLQANPTISSTVQN
jgi:hypothetical protein